jgi:hypothetical protein
MRPKEALGTIPNATRTTSDGRQYPAQRRQVEERTEELDMKGGKPKLTKKQVAELPPCRGLFQADRAIWALEVIESNDTQRAEAFAKVKGWIKENENI